MNNTTTKRQRKAALAAKKKKAKDKRREQNRLTVDAYVTAVNNGEDPEKLQALSQQATEGPLHKKVIGRVKLAWRMKNYVGGNNGRGK